MEAWRLELLLWTAFAGTHIALSSVALRPRLVARLGEGPFAGLYSFVALAIFVPLVWAYWGDAHTGPLLWSLRAAPGVSGLSILLGVAGFAFVAAAFLQPSAVGMLPQTEVRARGSIRITRHPLFVGLALWGLGHVLMNGFASDVVFFGGFVVFGWIGASHQDARKRALEGARLRTFYEETSLLPFAAILAGRTRLVASELPWLGIAGGAVLGIIIYLLHPLLFS